MIYHKKSIYQQESSPAKIWLIDMHEVVQVDFKLKLEEPSSNIVHLSNIYMHEIYAMINSRESALTEAH